MKHLPQTRPRERGVVLLFCLIFMLVLFAGAVAVMRSMNSSLFSAGNLAFKRDLVNQGEQAVSNVLDAFRTGTLSVAGATALSVPAANYSAVELQANARGVPLVLLDNGSTPGGQDIRGTPFSPSATAIDGVPAGSVSIRYVIDRLCNNTGTAETLGDAGCLRNRADAEGGTVGSLKPSTLPPSLIYRLSIRVDGPRATQVFLQTSFTKPD